jgi:CRISPR-associated endonuclease Csn1
MAKTILGLDLGTTSIGWAHVIEGETPETSEIVSIGVRVNPLTTDEQTNFEKGKPITSNADRTLKRSARRNLDRFQLRRKNLIEVLKSANIISNSSVLAENGSNTTFETWKLRAKAAVERVEKGEFARILLAINKKRGYKSSRKAKNEDDGQVIDGMAIAKRLYDENLTPGQLVYQLLIEGKKAIPDFYRSDLQKEFDQVWNFQQQFYPKIMTDICYKELQGKGQRATSAFFWTKYQFNTAENKGSREEKKVQAYKWRSEAINLQLSKEEVAYVLTEINSNLNNSSGHLGAISDRSKELYFNKQTVGQHLYEQLQQSPHNRLKNQVFYRQDYLDEFEAIWTEQAKHHSELTEKLKEEIRDIIIFYQRKLKSQKGLISFCEFENKEFILNGSKKQIGLRVAPKSSPLFQEFKIWQNLNNVLVRKKGSRKRIAKENDEEILILDSTAKELLFNELNFKGNISSAKAIEILGYKSSEWEMNYSSLEGNNTNRLLHEAYLKILDLEGYNIKDILKVKSNKDEIELYDLNVSANEIKDMIASVFDTLGIHSGILDFNPELDGKVFEQQPSYQLWHLIYSYEGDDSPSGNEKLYQLLEQKFGFKKEHGRILANISLVDDYGSLSTKAMRKIFTHIKENKYNKACFLAGYNHSASSLTKEEIANRPLKDKLELLKKNSLRNPVVEKILNQMVNVINTLIETNRQKNPNFQFDEVRIELARELKKNADERAEMTSNINASKITHDKISKILQDTFGIKNPTRNDIIRYKLYEELKNNGYKDLYTNEYIHRDKLFSKEVDIEHIIPQSRLFDDSLSNKTIVYRKTNLDKGNQTAIDYIESKLGEDKKNEFIERIEALYQLGIKNKEEGISKAKYQKLLKRESEIGDGFIERDLRDSQYIAKKAKNMLYDITRSVVSTSGSITDRLREDWDLINVMKELNLPKFRALGLTEMEERKFGKTVEVIKDWTKRNDHRHHAMDALTVAFTKRSFIQYLNNLNARRKDEKEDGISNSKTRKSIGTSDLKISTRDVLGIEAKELHRNEEGKWTFNLPIPNFRQLAKEHLENVLVSHKAKNKVVTKNKNRIKTKNGEKIKIELTPRGQLHKESVYGRYEYPVSKEEKVTSKFDEQTIQKVANPTFRLALLERLRQFDNDPKKAFSGKNSPDKNPLFLDESKVKQLPEKVKLVWFESSYSIRKDVTPENFKDTKTIEKILDSKVKEILQNRLRTFGNDPKKAFSDLDKNPIWLNESKGIKIKRATINGVSNAEPLHFKKDHFGNELFDKNGNKIPADFVSTGNNHHVAIYRDADGKLQERVVSLFDAIQLTNNGLPVIDKEYNKGIGWQFLFSMKQNEYFVFPNPKTGFNPTEIDLLDPKNRKKISPNLFRVQKISTKNYFFRHHLETTVEEKKEMKDISFKPQLGLSAISEIIKVRLNHIGQIVSTGEY